ncbi:MAG: hypothetical protein RR471_10185, partial [Bacteroides sp.]
MASRSGRSLLMKFITISIIISGAKIVFISEKLYFCFYKRKRDMRIGVISAMSAEQEQLIGLLDRKEDKQEGSFCWVEGRMGDHTLILVQSGIGKVNAAVGAMELIRCCRPDCVVSTGVA